MGCTLEVALPSVKTRETGMSDSTPVKNGLIPAGAQMSAWLVNDGCDFVKFV